MFEKAPNGYFVRDLIVFNDLARDGYVAKGFIFQPPDLTNAQVSELNEFQEQLSLLLASLNDNQRLQVQFFCDSDYRNELLRYQAETDRLATNPWTRRARNERFQRYWRQMSERHLRRQRLILYVSRKIERGPKGLHTDNALARHYQSLLDQLNSEFIQLRELLCAIFNGQGARIIPMTDADHYRHSESTLPSASKNLFFQTWPGWTWGKYGARKLYGETRYVADMLPISATFTGHLDEAEAIYEGAANNLVGIKTYSGEPGGLTPQHAVLIGMSGAGKSVTMCDLLSQTEACFAYTVIIEEGPFLPAFAPEPSI